MQENGGQVNLFTELAELLPQCKDLPEMLEKTAVYSAKTLCLDKVQLILWDGDGQRFELSYDATQKTSETAVNSLLRKKNNRITAYNRPLTLPVFYDDLDQTVEGLLKNALRSMGAYSFAAVSINFNESLTGWLECIGFDNSFRWTAARQQQLTAITQTLELAIKGYFSTAAEDRPEVKQSQPRVRRETGDASGESPWLLLDILEDGKIVYVSAKSRDILGQSPEHITGQNISDFLASILLDVYVPESQRLLEQVLSGDQSKSEFFAEIRNSRAEENRLFQFHVESNRPENSRLVLVMTDVTRTRLYKEKLDEARLRSMRLVEYGNIIIVRTNSAFEITDVVGDTEKILGVTSDLLLNDPIVWNNYLETEDFRSLLKAIRKMRNDPREFSHEISLIHSKSQKERRLLLTAVPLFSPQHELLGWEGFGLDITEKRQTELELRRQSRRIYALYEVSKSLKPTSDPAYVALKALKTLITATGADGGYTTFVNPDSNLPEVVAAHGCSVEFIDGLNSAFKNETLVGHVIEKRQGLLLDNLQSHPRASHGIAKLQNIKGAIMVPLMVEDGDAVQRVIGVMVLFSSREARFNQDDFDLAAAAAIQVCLVIRQAESYSAEMKEASSLAVLYRTSHALTKVHSPEEAAQCLFPLIQNELACKRMWMGVLNNQGTHVVGCGGMGPGISEALSRIQIELNLRHDFIDEALRSRQAVIGDASEPVDCSGLRRIVDRLKVSVFVAIPLVALGQVTGLMLLEPSLTSRAFIERKLPLIMSMANEVGAVLLARRLEEKIAGAEKMRMAGLLASGVAHNFNNLLQAVMGQASLIEMQLPQHSSLRAATHTIIDAASKGAELIRQMLNVGQHKTVNRQRLNLTELIEDSRELYVSLLGAEVSLALRLAPNAPAILADKNLVQQVISQLLINAKEAVSQARQPHVSIMAQTVKLRSSEVDPLLAPGTYLRIDVSDNGVGMDQENALRCFEPFYTTKNIDLGTGIGLTGTGFGLSLAYSIMRQHDGLITVDSQPNEGSSFSLYFPVRGSIGEEVDQFDAVREVGQSETNLRPRAIVIEADTRDQLMLRSTLNSLGFEVQLMKDGKRLFDRLRARKDDIQLLFVELDHLGEDALPWLNELRGLADSALIVGVSIDIQRWKKLTTFIKGLELASKPYSLVGIHKAVRKIIGRRTIEVLRSDRRTSANQESQSAAGQIGEAQEDEDVAE